jgi:hypothetical protein
MNANQRRLKEAIHRRFLAANNLTSLRSLTPASSRGATIVSSPNLMEAVAAEEE